MGKPLPKTEPANLPGTNPGTGGMLPGIVCEQRVRCGKVNCRCSSGELHGPYFYRFWWGGGKQHKTYVRLADVEQVKDACSRHQALMKEVRTRRRLHYTGLTRVRRLLRLIRAFEDEVYCGRI